MTTGDGRGPSAEPGRPLGSQYRLDDCLGGGSMGEVWRAHDRSGHEFAVKLLRPGLAANRDVVRRFLDEQRLLESIRDPHVVAVHDLVVESNTLAIVMDLVKGEDLRAKLRRAGTLPPAEACDIAAQVADGLTAIHAARIVHRDVKPENILLSTQDGRTTARVTDLGVAKVVDESDTGADTVITGTPRYMAPEIVAGHAPSPATDVYALGFLLYEMLVGRSPFEDLNRHEMTQAQLALDPVRPPGIDDDLWRLIVDLTRKKPMERPPMALVAGALHDFAHRKAGRPAAAPLAAPAPRRPSMVPYPLPTGPDSAATVVSLPPGGQPAPIPVAAPPAGSTAVLAPPAVARRGRGGLWALIAGLCLLIIAAVAVYLLFLRPQPSGTVTVTAAGSASRAVPTSAASSRATRTPSVTPTQSPTRSATPSPTPSATPAPFPPAGATACELDDKVAVNSVTSCPFALNVAAAYRQHGLGNLRVYSPTTDTWYDMACGQAAVGVVECVGGNNADVFIRA